MALTAANARGTPTDNVSGTSWGFSPTSDCTAGAGVLLCIAVDNSNASGLGHTFTISDSVGNTWTRVQTVLYDPGAANAGTNGACFFTNQNVGQITTGTTITVGFSAATVAKTAAIWDIVSDLPGGHLLFVAGGAGTGAATGTPTVTSATIDGGTPAHDVIIGWGIAESSDTWTGDADTTNGSWSGHQHVAAGAGATGQSITCQVKFPTAAATQTYNPTLTSADCNVAWAHFRETSSPGWDGGGWW